MKQVQSDPVTLGSFRGQYFRTQCPLKDPKVTRSDCTCFIFYILVVNFSSNKLNFQSNN